MKKIRLLQVSFDTEIKSYEIPAFRSAIAEKAGKEHILYHNHLSDSKFLYKYPLIQYKTISRKPTIICIDEGVDDIHHFFENRDWEIKISDRWLNMKIGRLHMNQFTMQVWDKSFTYSILDWLALKPDNYKSYVEMESLAERIRFLETILRGNIIAFAKGIGWTVDKTIKVNIQDIQKDRWIKFKSKKVLAFTLRFTSNVFLPNFIGLGKGVSKGFGVVKEVK